MKRAPQPNRRWQWWIVVAVFFALVLTAAMFAPRRTVGRVRAKLLPLPPPPVLDFRAAREVYPFSVVPGGVYDSAELAASIEHDPVVRQHYRDINVETLAPTRLDQPMLAYVSYRKGGSVFWTRNKLLVPRNELVLTDGKNFVRGRCGNRMTDLAPPPTKTNLQEDPPNLVFETPVPSIVELPPNVTPVLRVPTIFYGERRRARLREVPNPVPEPGTIALVLSGVAVLAGAAWRRRKLR